MGYTTVAALSNSITPQVLAELADDTNAGADLNDAATVAVIQKAIDDASNEIDLYLLGHLDMTDGTVQTKVEPLCRNMALYMMYQRRGLSHEVNPMAVGYQHAVQLLAGLAKSRLHTQIGTQQPPAAAISSTQNTTKVFTDSALEDML